MKKMLTLFLIFTISLHTFSAFAGTETLKTIIDEMNFELSQANGDEAVQKIATKYSETIKMMLDDSSANVKMVLVNEMIAISHPKIAQDWAQMMAVVDVNKLTQEQQAQMMLTLFQNHFAQGASWDGEGAGTIFLAIPLVLILLNLYSCGALFNAMFGWKWFKNGCA